MPRVEQGQNVRMLQSRRDVDLLLNARCADRRRQILAQHLDRDISRMPEVVGEIDGGHSARADRSLDAVTSREGASDAFRAFVAGHPAEKL
ncbi:MAG: hypothetical protein ABI664_01625 [bacterium]